MSLNCPRCRAVVPLDAQGKPPRQCPACASLLAPAEPQWFYAQNRQKNGPVAWSQLKQLAAAGRLRPGDMLLAGSGGKWMQASSVQGLFAPQGAVQNTPNDVQADTVGLPQRPADPRALRAPGEEAAPPPVPTVKGYEILGELGRGGMGVVYKAKQLGLNRLVALKMILSGEHAGTTEMARFRAEAEAVARLQHTNIVQIYEIGEQDGRPFFSLEYVDGGSLAQRLAGKPLDARPAAELTVTLSRAIHFAHHRGIVHRDLKPANVLLEAQGSQSLGLGVAKITDFGLAKQLDSAAGNTKSGAILGTPSYVAPEQAAGKMREVGPPADIYALGAMLYEMLTGRPPFVGSSPLDTILQVLSEEPVPPSKLVRGVPRDLETICLKCLNKSPGQRYPTADALADDVQRFLNGEPIQARPVGKIERTWRWCRRNPVPAALLVVVSLLLVVVTLGSAFGLYHLSRLSEDLVRSTAMESAAQESEMLEELNNFYSAKVVDRVKAYGVNVTHDYANKNGAIPLPASLTIDLGNHISEKSERGMSVRLYSDYPFKSRKDGMPKDAFEWEALGKLRVNPKEPVYKFEEYNGRASLRYTTARLMKESCVKCHNTHPESPKTNWKVGEVRGVMEIIRPLDRDVERTRSGLRSTFVLIGVISTALLLGLSAVVAGVGMWSRRYAGGAGKDQPSLGG
jgi:eukaryotic-like serine/threonine-protein kinase